MSDFHRIHARGVATAVAVTVGLVAAPAAWAQADAAATAGVSSMTKEEAVSGIIKACTENPGQKGCVDLRSACNAQRGAWKGDMIRICPALVGAGSAAISAEDIDKDDGGETFGEPRPSDKHEATLDKVARSCRANPSQGMCTSAREQCLVKYPTMPPGGQRFCRQIQAAPPPAPPEKPVGMHTAYAFQYAKIADAGKVKKVESLTGGHLSGRGFSQDGPYATAFDVTVAKAINGWYWDFSLAGGFGIRAPRLTIGVVAGVRGSGITGGEMETAWGVPVEAHATYAINDGLSAMAYGRPIWHFGETKRKKGATLGSFADEFELGAHLVWAKVGPPGKNAFGWMAGLVHHEWFGTAYTGLRVGFGFANQP